jgi:uracil-DNA glycosylase
MEFQRSVAASKMIASLNNWWELAGVDAAVGDMPVHWLALDVKPASVGATDPMPVVAKAQLAKASAKPAVIWPDDLDILKSMIASGQALPGNGFGTKPVVPIGAALSKTMIISDIPDQDELVAGLFGSGETGVLLKRMMAAIGIDLANCFWTALATTIPAMGDLDETELPNLKEFVRHQISIVRPETIILLGSWASKALLGVEMMEARKSLAKINHDVGNMAALTTFHPRTLIARPAMKAQAWKDLQMLAKRADL